MDFVFSRAAIPQRAFFCRFSDFPSNPVPVVRRLIAVFKFQIPCPKSQIPNPKSQTPLPPHLPEQNKKQILCKTCTSIEVLGLTKANYLNQKLFLWGQSSYSWMVGRSGDVAWECEDCRGVLQSYIFFRFRPGDRIDLGASPCT